MVVAVEDLVVGADWEAAEKLIFVCRLRSRIFFGAMLKDGFSKSASPHFLPAGSALRVAVASDVRELLVAAIALRKRCFNDGDETSPQKIAAMNGLSKNIYDCRKRRIAVCAAMLR